MKSHPGLCGRDGVEVGGGGQVLGGHCRSSVGRGWWPDSEGPRSCLEVVRSHISYAVRCENLG